MNLKTKLFIFLYLFVLISLMSTGQEFTPEEKSQIDSLNSLLEKTKGVDSLKINILLEKASFYYLSFPDTATKICKEALDISKKINNRQGIADCYSWLGYLYQQNGKISVATDLYEKSLSMCKEINDIEGIALNLNNLGGIYLNLGDVSKSLELFHESMKYYKIICDNEGIAYCLHNIGCIYHEQDEYELALKYYKNSLQINDEIGDKIGLAITYSNIGGVYNDQDDISKALEYYYKGLKIREELGDKQGIAYNYINIADIILDTDSSFLSLDYYLKSKDLFIEINDVEGLSFCYTKLGKYMLRKNEIDGIEGALSYGEKAYKLSKELAYISNIEESAILMKNIMLLKGNYKSAFEYFKEEIQMRDSVHNDENYKKAQKQEAKYEYEKQKIIDDTENEKLIAIEKEEKEKQRIISYAISLGLVLVLIFLIFVITRLNITKRQKRIIEKQKLEVEQQKLIVEVAHDQLEEKNKEIMDSITYAKRIQTAILPPQKIVKEYLRDSFILYKPKDIVAGDFYWMEHKDGKILLAAADCTGHGVPGAMVSVVCNNGLNRSVREHGLTDPGKILDKTREIVIREFEKSEEEVKDGMDIALCSLEGNTLKYAGAHNPLWIIRDNEIIEIKADKQPIGVSIKQTSFITQTIELIKGDSIYIFSDGYVDQFGGEKGKKFKSKAFKELLLSIQNNTMEEQRSLLDENFESWKGKLEQIDDVCIIGVKI